MAPAEPPDGNGENTERRDPRMPNTDNLKPPWKPGQSGNPGGRPKGPSLARAVMELLELPPAELQKPRPAERVVDRVAQSLVSAALTGDSSAVTAIRTILERTDGAVPQGVVHSDEREVWEVLFGTSLEQHANGNGNGSG